MNLKDETQAVANVVDYAGGKMVGRVKMQKIVFFLEAAQVGYGFDYEYRHYGPYSEQLADAAQRAQFFDLLKEKKERTQWGSEYSIYELSKSFNGELPSTGEKKTEIRKKLIKMANEASSVVLELAATALFLYKEGREEPWALTDRKKPDKAKDHLTDAKLFYDRLKNEIESLPDIGTK